ncbi:phospholipase A2 inhibitor gamma subunit B-like [Lithobates pipiens]
MLLLALFALTSLVTTGRALSCTKCSSSSNSDCTGGTVNCPADNECSTTYIEIITQNGTSTNIFRSCSPFKQCNMTGSSTFPGGSLRMAISCCSINNTCSPDKPILPQYNTTAQNGKSCSQCLSINSEQCTPDNSMLCTGNETRCMRLARTDIGYQTSALAFQGCATESICILTNQLFTTSGITTTYNYICNGASLGLHHGALMPLIIFALLLKLLL